MRFFQIYCKSCSQIEGYRILKIWSLKPPWLSRISSLLGLATCIVLTLHITPNNRFGGKKVLIGLFFFNSSGIWERSWLESEKTVRSLRNEIFCLKSMIHGSLAQPLKASKSFSQLIELSQSKTINLLEKRILRIQVQVDALQLGLQSSGLNPPLGNLAICFHTI